MPIRLEFVPECWWAFLSKKEVPDSSHSLDFFGTNVSRVLVPGVPKSSLNKKAEFWPASKKKNRIDISFTRTQNVSDSDRRYFLSSFDDRRRASNAGIE
jgi:hypothetical protein